MIFRVQLPVQVLVLEFLLACGSDGGSNAPIDDCPPRQLATNQAIFDCAGGRLADAQADSEEVAWIELDAERDRQYNAVGRFGSCSGVFIAPKGAEENSPAYILSNGHCIGPLLPPKSALFDIKTPNTMTFNLFVGTSQERLLIASKIVRYASMVDTDLAIVELDSSFGALVASGINPLQLAEKRPKTGDPVINIGIPAAGIASDRLGLRGSVCSYLDTVALREGPYTFSSSIRVQCSVLGGSSGSPIILQGTGQIAALINTTPVDMDAFKEDCEINRPCEVDSTGTVLRSQYNYAQDVVSLTKCFDSKASFDRGQAACDL